jgi:Photosynthetic reaction centre cytochrome C subunit
MNAIRALAVILMAASAACSTPASSEAPSSLRITLLDQADAIEVTGLFSRDLDRLRRVSWQQEEWERLLRVTVAPDSGAQAMLGTYVVTSDALRFTPRFPFDPGRQYAIRLDPSRLPGGGSSPVVTASVARPEPPAGPPTSVFGVYPSGGTVPENQLRMYLQFSAPMTRRGALNHLRILDDAGREVKDPFLPLDIDLWNDDATRLTVLFDPGRVKRGILPNVEMGRALQPGRRYTLVISSTWPDGQGRPLASEFRRTFRVAPPNERPIDVASWRIQPPVSGSRDPIKVLFPAPLDHGLLHSALGVARGGQAIPGAITVEAGETRWLFTPRDPWEAGPHSLIVLTTLEDPAGNRIGRAFEVPGGGPALKPPDSITVPFEVRGASQESERARNLEEVERLIAGREKEPAEKVFKNIELLKGRPAERLPGMMRALTGLIGVECSHCHVPDRWESEEKPAKVTARKHFAMQAELNKSQFAGQNAITCWICHRGQPKPQSTPPA